MAGPKKITLKSPIKIQGIETTELMLSEPDLGVLDDVHIEVSGEGKVRLNLGDIPKLIANMANIPPSDAKKIKLKDMREIIPPVMDYLGEFLPTGEG